MFGLRIGQPLEQYAVDHAKDGAVGANAECEREDHNEREGGIRPQLPHSVSRIVNGELNEAGAACISAFLFHLFVAAKREAGLAFSFLFGRAGPHEFFNLAIEVEAKLLIEFVFNLLVVNQRVGAITQIVQHGFTLLLRRLQVPVRRR